MKDSFLIVGGAGFVGSSLAFLLRRDYPGTKIVVFDNLKRRGSELNIPRLKSAGIDFIHGDIRIPEDLEQSGRVDILIDCAAEPSVLAGYNGSLSYMINTNLNGAINCLELARKRKADVIFLSTSRVYPIQLIRSLRYSETDSRLHLGERQDIPGVSARGITEKFPLEGFRSMYGASKLASELIISEYVEAFGISAVINRCGVLTGPWQMGSIEQGFIVLWIAKHIFGGRLAYIGYEGSGKQVRDILHVRDLYELLNIQLNNVSRFSGQTYNVGGGKNNSVSLLELTSLCRKATGNHVEILKEPETRAGDIPWYISDCNKVQSYTGWQPTTSIIEIVNEITTWIRENRNDLQPILG